jgi:hypothetical protein
VQVAGADTGAGAGHSRGLVASAPRALPSTCSMGRDRDMQALWQKAARVCPLPFAQREGPASDSVPQPGGAPGFATEDHWDTDVGLRKKRRPRCTEATSCRTQRGLGAVLSVVGSSLCVRVPAATYSSSFSACLHGGAGVRRGVDVRILSRGAPADFTQHDAPAGRLRRKHSC